MSYDQQQAIPLSRKQQAILLLLSWVLTAFGQPAWSWPCALITACAGIALFWRVLLEHQSRSTRFWLSAGWFGAVQLVQLSWQLTHPFSYIYIVYLFFVLALGAQFGCLGMMIRPKILQSWSSLIGLAGFWTLQEWMRLFFLSGFVFNPIGLAWTGSIYPLQLASVAGVYGLSFWVILTNLAALRAWHIKRKTAFAAWSCLALFPFIFGGLHLWKHEHAYENHAERSQVLLVQTAFPIEEAIDFPGQKEMLLFVIEEWKKILELTQPYSGKKMDLIVFPEYVVPYGTYSLVYPYSLVESIFQEVFGPESIAKLPPLEDPVAYSMQTQFGQVWMVNNAYWLQGIANVFDAEVIAGLQDAEEKDGKREYYSAAIHFQPSQPNAFHFEASRYEKRILLPMAEYIPSSLFQNLAASYGIRDSFTAGKEAKVLGKKFKLGPSVCYEELFGDLMRENKLKGAQILVNMSNDGYYPSSRLPKQHFDHARLRTVENGIPLIRACNTGVTAAVDSLGRVVSVLGDFSWDSQQLAAALLVQLPTYSYSTLYSQSGDFIIILFSSLAFLLFAFLHLEIRLPKTKRSSTISSYG
jgi:apolipoprotein N-acyltransferase